MFPILYLMYFIIIIILLYSFMNKFIFCVCVLRLKNVLVTQSMLIMMMVVVVIVKRSMTIIMMNDKFISLTFIYRKNGKLAFSLSLIEIAIVNEWMNEWKSKPFIIIIWLSNVVHDIYIYIWGYMMSNFRFFFGKLEQFSLSVCVFFPIIAFFCLANFSFFSFFHSFCGFFFSSLGRWWDWLMMNVVCVCVCV